MSDQSKLGIGQIITEPQSKDAIHMAIAPMLAAERLNPGQRVSISVDGNALGAFADSESVGVVDPFLKRSVQNGERFWLFLNPGTITGLRHEWSHPAFVDSQTITKAVSSESEKWLREFANQVDADYDEMMEVAATHCEGSRSTWGEYLIQGGKWEGQSTPEEFWTHFTAVTGKKPKTEYGLPGIFSCSC